MPPLDPAANSDKSGNGSQDSQDDKPMVPLSALEAERTKRQDIEKDLAELKGRVDGMQAVSTATSNPAPAAAQVKTYSRTELEGMIASGAITEAQRDEQLDIQSAAAIAKAVDDRVGAVTTEQTVGAKIDAYTALQPDILVPGTVLRGKVEASYQEMVKDGIKAGNPAQLAAIRSVLGPIAALSKPGVKPDPEPSSDLGAGGNPDNGIEGEGSGPPAKLKLSPRRRTYYQTGIDNGRYKNWAAVAEILGFADNDVLARADARNRASA